jgi:putative MATE family efflux protein
MLTEERRRTILTLALPIIGGMASQNVLNLVDTAMVGLLGAPELAAVGMGSFANFMATAFIMGLSAGVQALAARRLGQGRVGETAVPLNGGLLLASFRGYWNGVNLSKVYMRTLIVMHLSNIFLNWVLIFGKLGLPAFGATGAGMGSAIATYLGVAMYIVQAFVLARGSGFLRHFPNRQTLVSMLRLSVPTGIQQTFFATGMTVLFWIIGRIGTEELAASTVLVHLLLVAILPGIGFGMASTSLVGQALGRADVADAKRWGWDVGVLAAVLVGLLALVGLLFPSFMLGFFLHEPETLRLALLPLQIMAAAMWWDTLGLVLMNSLLGAGDNRRVMAVTVSLQWGMFLPVAFLVGPVLGWGLASVWAAQVGYRSLQTAAFVVMWHRGRWADIVV